MAPYQSTELIALFSRCFSLRYNTQLQGGADEPLYEPATGSETAIIHFRHDYFASALHEIAHWCIAGKERRKQLDYGYWYIEEGRDAQQQDEFLMVEVKPQSLEWAFSIAAQYPFRISLDNLSPPEAQQGWAFWDVRKSQELVFADRCLTQIETWFESGFPGRASVFISALIAHYRNDRPLAMDEFRTYAWA